MSGFENKFSNKNKPAPTTVQAGAAAWESNPFDSLDQTEDRRPQLGKEEHVAVKVTVQGFRIEAPVPGKGSGPQVFIDVVVDEVISGKLVTTGKEFFARINGFSPTNKRPAEDLNSFFQCVLTEDDFNEYQAQDKAWQMVNNERTLTLKHLPVWVLETGRVAGRKVNIASDRWTDQKDSAKSKVTYKFYAAE